MRKINISEITLSDLMADDFTVWLGENKNHGYDLSIEGHDDDSVAIDEEGIHPYAIDAMADFCSSFLMFYKKIKDRNEKI